jgi:hypothetical protein
MANKRENAYSVGPIADRHEVCDQNRHDAISRGKKDIPFDKPPGQIRIDFLQQLV